MTPDECRRSAAAFLDLGRRYPRVAFRCAQVARGWLAIADELELGTPRDAADATLPGPIRRSGGVPIGH